jgi:predicted metal-binding membrane protein
MMVAMMLPSAAPMILLYRTVTGRLPPYEDPSIPVVLFAAVYLLLWLLFGVPVYLASVAVANLSLRSPWLHAAMPYLLAGVLVAAGVYQFTAVKRACLRHCEQPLEFLMRQWRGGYRASLRLAVAHASYCIGCCWGLMVILVAAGAMSLPWVLAIAVIVFAEKVLPRGGRTARLVGVALIVLGLAVALRPELASRLTPHGMTM